MIPLASPLSPIARSVAAFIPYSVLAALLVVVHWVHEQPASTKESIESAFVEEAVVGPLVDCLLSRVHVRDGDRVTAGQVVATCVSEEVRSEEARLVEHLACDSITCVLLGEASRIRLRAAGLDEADLRRSLREGPSGRIRLRAPVAGTARLHDLAEGASLSWRDDVLTIEALGSGRAP